MKSEQRRLLARRGVPSEVLSYRGAVQDGSRSEHAQPDCLLRVGRDRTGWSARKSTGTLGACSCADRSFLASGWGMVYDLKVLGTAAALLEGHRLARGVLARTEAALPLAAAARSVRTVQAASRAGDPFLHRLAVDLARECEQACEETFAGLGVLGDPRRDAAVRALGLREECSWAVELSSSTESPLGWRTATRDVQGTLLLELYTVAQRSDAVLLHVPSDAVELLYRFAAERRTSRGVPLLEVRTCPDVDARALDALGVLYEESMVPLVELVEASEALSA